MFESAVDPRHAPLAEALLRWGSAPSPHLVARWLWLRSLGLIFFSAFLSLYFQIHGLIGPNGILPARDYLLYAREAVGVKAFWLIPSLLWIDAGSAALSALVWIGLGASLAITFNLLPRAAIAVAGIAFLSFVAAAQDFSGYQSDSMLLEAALLSMFVAPRGVRPGFGRDDPPTRAAVFLLQWEWFRIYFQSGLVKLMSGDEQWRNLTAMDEYYENGPLPTLLGWYVHHWPHGFHAFTALATLVIELLLVGLLFVRDRRVKLILFAITTPLQIGIILTANYAFLNYLVLALGFLLLEDRQAVEVTTRKTRQPVALAVLFAFTVLDFFIPPLNVLRPFRVANSYGLFAVMTRERYELEFQGTRDGKTWIAYPFKHKPQRLDAPPRFFAPYQPRFDWNLWFASLRDVRYDAWVMVVQQKLLENERDVLDLFAGNPFGAQPPIAVRVVRWQYWFTTPEERARTGNWWKRQMVDEYSPPLTRQSATPALP